LPFQNGSFDGITAASSIEQTPDPYATLCELYRVLRAGGKLRISYEALSRYRSKPERGAWLMDTAAGPYRLVLNERQMDQERVIRTLICLARRRRLSWHGASKRSPTRA
jgi:ubiquinone/menaquinone biosynthesis C-methylase UbiE